MHLLVEEVDHLLLAEPEGDVAHLRCGISILTIFCPPWMWDQHFENIWFLWCRGDNLVVVK